MAENLHDASCPRSEEARSRLAHRVNDQRAIQKEIPCFAASLRDQQTAVARCTMQRSVVIGSGRIVVSTYRIARTKALPFQSGLENSHKPPCDLDETTQGALIACRGGVDQDPALNWLPCNTRQHVEALLQRACRVSAIECHLAHQSVRETVRHHVLWSLTFPEAILAHHYASGALRIDPSGRPSLKLSRACQYSWLGQPISQDFRGTAGSQSGICVSGAPLTARPT